MLLGGRSGCGRDDPVSEPHAGHAGGDSLDPLVRRYFPQWVVQDEAMILEIMRKIRDNRDDLRDAEAVEIADRVHAEVETAVLTRSEQGSIVISANETYSAAAASWTKME